MQTTGCYFNRLHNLSKYMAALCDALFKFGATKNSKMNHSYFLISHKVTVFKAMVH